LFEFCILVWKGLRVAL